MRRQAALVLLALAGGVAADAGTPRRTVPPLFGPGEELHFAGTEPFWGGTIRGRRMVYSTPDNEKGETLAVRRFVGHRRITFRGTMAADGAFTMTVWQAVCSDGMSERSYPFEVRIKYDSGGVPLQGCGWTMRRPFRDESGE